MTKIDNTQEEINQNLFGKFMKNVSIWDYTSISSDSYLALSHDEKEKLIWSYSSNMKSRRSGKFYFTDFFVQEVSSCLINVLCRGNL